MSRERNRSSGDYRRLTLYIAHAAVYANTLVFSGRILALAFFRIDGVALKLIRALPPVKRLTLRRVLQEAGANEK